MPLKIIFCGTPDFSVPVLQALLDSSHSVIAVLTKPDRPSGRGQKLISSPVKQLAEKNNLPIYQPKSLRDVNEQKILQELKPDLMVVVAYGLILPQAVLNIPKYGCINVHASLLPRWRGAAPIQRAILAGDKISGVTIMQMDKGLDTGDMLLKKSCEISPNESGQELHDELSNLGAKALIETLELLEKNNLKPEKQNDVDSCYATKIEKEEAKINWQDPAQKIHNLIRGFNSWPVAFTQFKNQNLRIWKSEIIYAKKTAKPGTLIKVDKEYFEIATGDGILRILELQMPGGKRMSTKDFLNSHRSDLMPNETILE